MKFDFEPDELTVVFGKYTDQVLDEHISTVGQWHPHDLVPWDKGRNYAFLGGEDWNPSDTTISRELIDVVTLQLLHKDHHPSYHRLMAQNAPGGVDFFRWNNRWTAEENAHAIALRDYVVVTRNSNPEELEMRRLQQVTAGYMQTSDANKLTTVDVVAMLAFTEQVGATMLRNGADRADSEDPVLARLLREIAEQDQAHADAFIKFLQAGYDIDPDTVESIVRRHAGAASPIGADWGTPTPEVDAVSAAGIFTDTDLKQAVAAVLTRLSLQRR